nr:MAG TPA: hypothetical protein [Caudoviricetes sp.]
MITLPYPFGFFIKKSHSLHNLKLCDILNTG